MSDLKEEQYRFLKIGEVIRGSDRWEAYKGGNVWSSSSRIGKRVDEDSPKYRRLVTVKYYRYLEVGERVNPNTDQYYSRMDSSWKRSSCRIRQKRYGTKYRRLTAERKLNDEETNVPISPDRREASTDSSSKQSDRDRHVTIDKSNYRWDGSVDLTKQHCISVSVEEV